MSYKNDDDPFFDGETDWVMAGVTSALVLAGILLIIHVI